MGGVAVRLAWVDRLRGLAIGLMIVDHALVQVAPSHVLRFTATRLALPLFMLAAAMVFAGVPSRRRRVQLLAAVAGEAALFSLLGMAGPGIVFVYAVVLLSGLLDRATASPWIFATVGFLAARWWPLDAIFGAYHPGEVVAWWCLGFMASGERSLIRWAHRLPEWVGAVGRRPLAWYVGHLLVLVVAVQFV